MWRRLGLVVMAALGLLMPAGPLPAQPAPSAVQAIPVALQVPFVPSPVLAEGYRHIVYELHVTNMGHDDLTLQSVTVTGADGPPLAVYAGADLDGVLARPGLTAPDHPAVIGAGLGAVVYVDVRLPAGSPVPTRLRHSLVFAPVTLANTAGPQTTVTGAAITIPAQKPVVLAPPLRGSGWLASHGLSNTSSHRRTPITLNGRTTIAQRFAIDWTRIGDDGQIFRGDPANNANWTPYGADVLAVAAGRVIEATDGLPENDPTKDDKAIPITFDNATGNHIVLDIGGGRYVLYAHLRPGSLRVHIGDTVHTGDVLAQVGNSGKADAPHLHFQVMDGPEPLASEGLPFVFRSFTLEGHVSTLSVFVDGTGWHASDAPQAEHDSLPLENAVVAFDRP